MPALKPLKPFKPFRRPFQGNPCTFPQAFPTQLSQLHTPDNASNPSAGLSKATLAATRPSHLFLRAFKSAVCPPSNPSNPSAGLSKATLAATRPRQCFKPFRRPFQGNSRSYTFARPQTPQTPEALLQAFPRELLQLLAGLSKATLAATCPRQCFKPFRKPFQGNSRSYTPQPSVFKGVQDCRLSAFKPLKPFRKPFQGNSRSYIPQPSAFKRFKTAVCSPSSPSNPSAGLSKAPLAASRKPFQGNSRSYTPQTVLQTLPQAFPRQLSQLHAPAICF